MTQEELRQLLEYRLGEYMGTENAKNLDKWGTPENKLVNQLMHLSKQYVEEVIGEDETSQNVEKMIIHGDPSTLAFYRNVLRAVQRKAAGL